MSSYTMPDEPSPDYADLRSAEHARNRHRKQSQKYYGYRGVHRSWPTQQSLHLTLNSPAHPPLPFEEIPRQPTMLGYLEPALIAVALRESPGQLPTQHTSRTLSDAVRNLDLPAHATLQVSIAPWTKRDNYVHCSYGIWPLDRRHHRGKRIREKGCAKLELRQLGRSTKQRAGLCAEQCAELHAVAASGLDFEFDSTERGLELEDCEAVIEQMGLSFCSCVHEDNLGVCVGEVDESDALSDDFEMISDISSVGSDEQTWELISEFEGGD